MELNCLKTRRKKHNEKSVQLAALSNKTTRNRINVVFIIVSVVLGCFVWCAPAAATLHARAPSTSNATQKKPKKITSQKNQSKCQTTPPRHSRRYEIF